MEDSPDARVAVIAARRRGLFTLAQARDVGTTESALRHRLRTGRWERLHPSVFRIAGSEATPEQRVLAACLHLGPMAVASHATAAWLWELDGFAEPPSRPEVTLLGTAPRTGRGILVHRTRVLVVADRAERRGIPVTAPVRTLVDLGRTCARERVQDARDAAHREGLVSLRREAVELRRLALLPGAAVLRSLLDEDAGGAPAQSRLERDVLRTLAARGVPSPVRQHPVVIAGQPYRIDVAWPELRVGLEAHSRRWHFGVARTTADLGRGSDLASDGWLIVVVTKADVRAGGAEAARRVLGALRSRGALGA